MACNTLRLLPVGPLTRSECREWKKPCALTGCRYHLEHDDNPPIRKRGDNGNHERRLRKRQEADVTETCALSIAERGEASFEEIGRVYGITKERAERIEKLAIAKFKDRMML